jgi:geranyl-CoA carboxylase alpha subunit
MKIQRILIANRSEIARRIIRTAHALGIETVAVYSDADANGLHVREATLHHALGGNASADTYLRVDKLLAAAKTMGADAVHPGYGFLSENADFAQAVMDAGLVWIGPPPAAMRALGSKSAAKQIALEYGVPTLPGYFGADQSDARFVQEAARIGYPVMVKAVAGGGGRGMRLVHSADALPAALHSARAEAAASFASDELLLERALLNPSHVEVQVFADTQGNCIHLGERDCSVQRRHQKLIEESPSPAVDAALRERMGACAVQLAKAAGYVGAGTVEFLLEGTSNADRPPLGERPPPAGSAAHAVASGEASFFLMEMNTRLQVEHPVTEMRCGIDLVEWQIRVARGEALPLAQESLTFQGHAIEVRLCAEDAQYVPHTGQIRKFVEPLGAVRFDHAMFEGMQVTSHYDSMLGKLIVHAATRGAAINAMVQALQQCVVLGLPTNRHFLLHCLNHTDFRAGHADIAFLLRQADAIRKTLLKQELLTLNSIGLEAIYASKTPPVLACPFDRPVRVRQAGVLHDLPTRGAPPPTGAISVQTAPLRWHVQHAGVDLWVEDASFEPPLRMNDTASALELRAPMNGKVLAITVQAGSSVQKGDVLLTIESMKLEHAITAQRRAVVEAVQVSAGQQVAPQQVLMRFVVDGNA